MYTFEALPWFLIKQAGWGFRLVQDILHRNNLSLCGREAIISCKKFASRAPKAVGFYHSPPLQEQQRAFQRENSCIKARQISLPDTGRTPARSHCSREIESSQSCQCSCPRDGFSAVVYVHLMRQLFAHPAASQMLSGCWAAVEQHWASSALLRRVLGVQAAWVWGTEV